MYIYIYIPIVILGSPAQFSRVALANSAHPPFLPLSAPPCITVCAPILSGHPRSMGCLRIRDALEHQLLVIGASRPLRLRIEVQLSRETFLSANALTYLCVDLATLRNLRSASAWVTTGLLIGSCAVLAKWTVSFDLLVHPGLGNTLKRKLCSDQATCSCSW